MRPVPVTMEYPIFSYPPAAFTFSYSGMDKNLITACAELPDARIMLCRATSRIPPLTVNSAENRMEVRMMAPMAMAFLCRFFFICRPVSRRMTSLFLT